jgi:hypothetical protein
MTARYSAPCVPSGLSAGRGFVLMAGRHTPSPDAKTHQRLSAAQWTGAHISKSPDSKTEFNEMDGLRTYIRTVPATSLPALLYFGAICPARVL